MTVQGTIAAMALSGIMMVLAAGYFTSMFDSAAIRIAAVTLVDSLEQYRQIHCDAPAGEIRSAAAVLSDVNAFPPPFNGVDPAENLFAWQYETGAGRSASFVIVDDLPIRRRIQTAIGGVIEAPNRLVLNLSPGFNVSIPNLAVNTMGEGNATPPCF